MVCVELPHGHGAGMAVNVQKPGNCSAGGQNSDCGFETSQEPDKFHFIVSSIRSYNPLNTGIFTTASDGYEPSFPPDGFISQVLLSDSDGAVPIYLQNQSLLR